MISKPHKKPENSKEPRRHKGDIMSPEKRSNLMSKIRGKDTSPEILVASYLATLGLSGERHARDLPGRPDFVFRESRIAIFVDGDFWHGWRFSIWKDKLSEKWEAKIQATRCRDTRNHRRLKRLGWTVIRIWEHQLERDLEGCMARIEQVLRQKHAIGKAAAFGMDSPATIG